MRAIIIMGVSGCGKSTLAAALAKEWSCRFIEGDDLHDDAARAKMADGIALSDDDRWPWLDRIAAAVNGELSHRVIVTCSALKRSYRDRLRTAIGSPLSFVCLTAPHAELERRLAHRTGHYMPLSLLDSQLAAFETPEHEDDVLMLAPGEGDPIRVIESWV